MRGLFSPLKKGDPARLTANVEDQTFIRNFIDDLRGINCRVVIPQGLNGKGARIIVDGATDIEKPDNIPNPFTGGEADNVFPASVTNSASGWTFTELKIEAAILSDLAGGKTGEAIEFNGIAAPDPTIQVYTFNASMHECDDNGTLRYAFPFPMPSGGQNRNVLQKDANNIPVWGCLRGTS